MMGSAQEEFDHLVSAFNSDYVALLQRAANGDYDRLVEAFVDIKDLHDVIVTIHDVEDLIFAVPLHPILGRANPDLLERLGFEADQITAIQAFLEFFKQSVGRELDEVGSGGPDWSSRA